MLVSIMSVTARVGGFWRRAPFALLTLCVIIAIVVQDHTGYLPLGVFNTGAQTLAKISLACLCAAILALIVQLIELFRGRFSRAGGMIRGLYVSILLLDVLLILGDRVFVTGRPGGRLGQYYEVPDSGHPPVILKKAFRRAPPGPCLGASDSASAGPRILFLGDSYTEGSGSRPECNYPTVVERVLRGHGLANARVINAGVSGYGPVEALHLLRWYRAQGCPVDAVVYNLTLQNDFADNLPRTERRVVAGIIFRFPHNVFLRTFHPLNTRIFRWALVLVYFGKASTQEMINAVSVPGDPCHLEPQPLTEVSPFLRATVERDLESARRVAEHGMMGYEEAARAIREMQSTAREWNVPFVLVVFPERIVADRELQESMDGVSLDASRKNHEFARSLGRPALDAAEVLAGRPGMYRTVDTHLSDLGNVVAGEYVGAALAWRLTQKLND
jgi:hypothetical protein